jgi:hypothetical protein
MSRANYIFFTRPSAIFSEAVTIGYPQEDVGNGTLSKSLQGADRRVEVVSKLAMLAKKN